MKTKSIIGLKPIPLLACAAVWILVGSRMTNAAVKKLGESELANIKGGCKCCWEEMPDTVLCSCGTWGPPPPRYCKEEEDLWGNCCFCANPGAKCAESVKDGPKADDSCEHSDKYFQECEITTEACCTITIYRCTQHHVPKACGCDPTSSTRDGGTRDVCEMYSDLCF
jgi:hypothetical protein